MQASLPTPILYVLSAMVTFAIYCEWRRYQLLTKASLLTVGLPPPYNDIARWYLVFDSRDLPPEYQEKTQEILKLMRERVVYKAAQFLLGLVLMLGLAAFFYLRRSFSV